MLGSHSKSAKQTESSRDSEAAHTFLLRVGEVLSYSLEYETTLQNAAHQAVPLLADMCFVDLAGPDGRLRPVAVAHIDPGREARLRDQAVESGAEAPAAALRAFRTGQPVIVANMSERVLLTLAKEEQAAPDPRTIAAIQEVGPRSTISMPMIARGRVLGVLSLGRLERSPRFDEQDLPLIKHLARLCAQAVDNAGLYREATEAVRVREEFLATTSHELRTPLSQIKGFVTTLLRTDVEWDEATRRDFLREIDLDADRLDALISDLLDMSRLSSGGCDLQRAPTPPAALVCRGLDRVRVRLSHTAVDVDRKLGALPALWVDARRIEQVIANLVENAIKYAPGSRIRLYGALADAGETVELSVEDNGPGIPAADVEHIFETFYRGRTREQSETSGSGLGLAIARKIVESHGGRIRAENRPGGGARFVFGLPAASSS